MPLRRRHAPPAWACRLLAALLILGAGAGHVLYLFCACPLDLAPDEAHYWDWSRHLDWSYYSKGPLVAYLIRLGCELFGPLSLRLTGTLMPAIRLPAVVCGTLLLVSMYLLALRVYRREGLALGVVAIALTLPPVVAGSSLMTIDAPFTCFWGWALLFGYLAAVEGRSWAWPAAGLMVALGTLAKYTMVLWLPSLALFLLTTPAFRPLLRRRGFWVMCAVSALGGLPILIWNAEHDWVTFRHLIALSGALDGINDGGPRFKWWGPLVYVGGQCGLLLIFWFVAWAAAMVSAHPWREADPGTRFLWWMSAPTFLVFWGFSVKNGGGELNWPITAYLSGLVLAAAWLARQLESPSAGYRRWTRLNIALACSAGLFLTVLVHRSDWFFPVLARLVGPPTAETAFPLRKIDPTCRLRGWRALASAIDEHRAALRAEGVEPVLAATNWALPGLIGVYCDGRPQAYSLGMALNDRASQYDLWPGPVSDPDDFRGRTFLVVGVPDPELWPAFERWEGPYDVHYAEQGQPIAAWSIYVCRGYKGFPARAGLRGRF
jgi:4-amino-4-deoxy-L-arabinose transferase-like glycosyltransferase